MKVTKNNYKKGFTLIEIIVSISVFTFVMFISTGSILSVFNANKKSQNLRSVMDNLNYTLEAMTRTIRFGSVYHCDITQGSLSSPADCTGGATSMSVTDSSGVRYEYRLNSSRIERSVASAGFTPITASDTIIDTLTFYVLGSTPFNQSSPTHDTSQPRVIIVVKGHVGTKATIQSSFTLQTTVSQRGIDSQ